MFPIHIEIPPRLRQVLRRHLNPEHVRLIERTFTADAHAGKLLACLNMEYPAVGGAYDKEYTVYGKDYTVTYEVDAAHARYRMLSVLPDRHAVTTALICDLAALCLGDLDEDDLDDDPDDLLHSQTTYTV